MKNLDNYIEAISINYPNIEINDIRAIEEGQNNIILVANEDIVFRFPRNEMNKKVLKEEYKVLVKLGKHVPLKIPTPQYSSFTEDIDSTFIGYPLIHGVVMKREVYIKSDDKNKLANQLALFLKKLHSEQVLDEVGSLLQTKEVRNEWLDLYCRIKGKLFSYMREEAVNSIISEFEVILNGLDRTSFQCKLVHGDFGPSNIIVDKNLCSVNGIIDFGSTHIGDPAYDIASLIGPFGYGMDFINLMTKDYFEISTYVERAKSYTKTFALQEALYGIENNDNRAFEAGIKEYL